MDSLMLFQFAVLVAIFSSQKSPFVAHSASQGILADRNALISFKSLIIDPSNTLSSWNQNSTHCNWTGVACNKKRERVVALELQGLRLLGTISPYLGNLSFLRYLHLQDNAFTGTLPDQIGDLFRLRVLNISSNRIKGAIPHNITSPLQLEVLDFTGNEISGRIPEDLDRLSKLQVLSLKGNQLSGGIPPSIANLSSLVALNLMTNSLTGTIPGDLGRLSNLKQLHLAVNELSGTVPSAIYNLTSLCSFVLGDNQLTGEFPANIGHQFANLTVLILCFNEFTGTIPRSVFNITKIQILRMSYNLLTGSLPPGLGALSNLEMFNIGFNRIVNLGDSRLSFIDSLTNSTSLKYLAFDGNLFEGVLPESIGNLSKSLKKLYMGGNRIYGTVPSSIGSLTGLELLNMSHNSLSGVIPPEISQLKELHMLGLAGNNFSGAIPDSLGNLSKLYQLQLFGNDLQGRIPPTFGNYQQLLTLDLSHNRLNGSIPKEILRLSSLSAFLNLSNNLLSGTLPWDTGTLVNVVTMDVSNNRLSGSIPNSISNFRSLENLFIANNSLSGQIPDTIVSLKGLKILDLSSNQLSGSIPSDLQKLRGLQLLNVSFNNLEGEIPKDGIFRNLSQVFLEGNSKLCLPLTCKKSHGRRTHTGLIAALIPASVILCLIVGSVCLLLFWRGKAKIIQPSHSLKQQHQLIPYDELRRATQNFAEANLIGKGSFGSVYKGALQEGNTIAIKVLDLERTGASKSFLAECEALKNVRHRNLVKLITSCSSINFMNMSFQALVYEFMSNGSLEDWISGIRTHPNGHGLNVLERLKVAMDVACSMDYLHHDCEVPVVHCDLKPSNVLLNDDFTAKVGDFGLARLLIEKTGDQQSITTTHDLKGSVGYIPPEYGLGGKPSSRGDVYSYGIMLLELFTGKSPTHENFKEGISLSKWVQSAFPTNMLEVLDPLLLLQISDLHHEGRKISAEVQHQCLITVMGVGLSCSVESSDSRLSMREALHKLKIARSNLNC